ncbi:hypothetical protein VPH35_004507 [Triticum aestivum]
MRKKKPSRLTSPLRVRPRGGDGDEDESNTGGTTILSIQFIHCPKQQHNTKQHAAPTQFQLTFPIPSSRSSLVFPIPFAPACFFSPRRRSLGPPTPTPLPLPPHPQESQPASQPRIILFSARRPDAAARRRRCPSAPTPAPRRLPAAQVRFAVGLPGPLAAAGGGRGKAATDHPSVHAARDGAPAPPRNAGFSAARPLGSITSPVD